MNFISMQFLILFPFILLICRKLPQRAWIWFVLAASYLFYMNGISWIGLLLLYSTFLSWLAARQIEKAADGKSKKLWLAAVVCHCMGCLLLFKQKTFLVPGISFYMFQALSYVLDVYRKKLKSERSFSCYALYVSFFPQLAAGPIERAAELLPQLKNAAANANGPLAGGFFLMLRGFFKKLAVADYLAPFVETVYKEPRQAGGLAAAVATFFFAVQIYCDFSGYTDIARGAAQMMGIRLMENFDRPYEAENIGQFWRRWHISLTKWLTDYVYIPLGGSRHGFFRTCLNRIFVFGVSGLWHGLSMHYVVWGLLHGMYFTIWHIAHRFCDSHGNSALLQKHLARLGTFAAVCFAWIFFRADSVCGAWTVIRQIVFHFMDVPPSYLPRFFHITSFGLLRLMLVFVCLFLLERMPEDLQREKTMEQAAHAAFFVFCIVTVCVLSWLSVLADNGGNTFLYFSF